MTLISWNYYHVRNVEYRAKGTGAHSNRIENTPVPSDENASMGRGPTSGNTIDGHGGNYPSDLTAQPQEPKSVCARNVPSCM